ncbi:hypothetical protein L1049_020947 [Liquidambar formosana]|uniref:Uncharacterized protein n=1 Tax=Liquidambar formosana TaxID=63359 RepID=A0AAP0S8Y7_LIQFO
MTKLHNLCALVALFLASSAMLVEPGLASKAARPTPPQLQVHISLDEIAYVLNYGKKLIHDWKRCLDTTVKGLFSMPLFHKYSAKALPKIEAVWNCCALIAYQHYNI